MSNLIKYCNELFEKYIEEKKRRIKLEEQLELVLDRERRIKILMGQEKDL